jgi:hypothetical protein
MVGKEVLTTVFSSATRRDVIPKPMMIDQNLSPRSCFCPSVVSELLCPVKLEPTVSVGFSDIFNTPSSLCVLAVAVILAGHWQLQQIAC